MLAKHILIAEYKLLVGNGEWPEDEELLKHIRMKPGSARFQGFHRHLPKSYSLPGPHLLPHRKLYASCYLADERCRAFQNKFDPFNQVNSRILEYEAVGHPTDKIELPSFWAAPGALTAAITRNGSSNVVLMP